MTRAIILKGGKGGWDELALGRAVFVVFFWLLLLLIARVVGCGRGSRNRILTVPV